MEFSNQFMIDHSLIGVQNSAPPCSSASAMGDSPSGLQPSMFSRLSTPLEDHNPPTKHVEVTRMELENTDPNIIESTHPEITSE